MQTYNDECFVYVFVIGIDYIKAILFEEGPDMVQACSSASQGYIKLTLLVFFSNVWCCFTTLRISAILYEKKTMMKWSGHCFRGLNTVHDITLKSDLQGPCSVWKYTM